MNRLGISVVAGGMGLLLWGAAVQAAPPVAKTPPPVKASPASPENPKPFILGGTNVTANIAAVALSSGRADLMSAHEDLQAGRRDAAITKLEGILRRDPGLPAAWETLGWAYWQAGRSEDSIKLWMRWQSLDPTLPNPCNLLGQAYVARNETAKAIASYSKSLSLNPDQFEITFALARIYRWIGELDRAVEMLRTLLAKDPARNDVKVELARALVDNRQYEEAGPMWTDMLKLSPTNLEYMVREAAVLLHTGKVKESKELTDKILALDTTNVQVYQMQADMAEAGEHPEEAIPPLRKMIANARDMQQKQQFRTRLVRLLIRLNQKAPLSFALNEPLSIVRDMLRDEPNNVDTNLMLAELMLMEHKFSDAERQFVHVLKNYNPNNQRARRGLFETYIAMRRFADAKKQYDIIAAFNPHDPYLYLRQAKLEESRGDYSGADKALQNLQRSASRGSVAVLIYHGLTTSEWLEIHSVRLFQEHLAALKKAGFKFITPDEIPAYMAKSEKAGGAAVVPERVVCVTFDDARRDAMRYGTEIAKQMGVKLAMHVPVGNVERGDAFICTWDMLKQYQDSGAWVLGSHLMYASDILPVAADRQTGYPLANRLWLEQEGRLETDEEYAVRIKAEYRRSRELMEKNLGRKVSFMAYPMGDVGQETSGNAAAAILNNMAEASTNYAVGFVQSPFGYAVNGDNPLLYQRYEVERGVTGEELVQHIFENHPYYLGLAMRAQMAALQGKLHRARELVQELKQSGYPEALESKLSGYVNDHLSGQYAALKAGSVIKGPLHLTLSDPYVGARAEYFQDNLDSRNWRMLGYGGLNLTPNLIVEGRAGFGQMKQPMTNSLPPFPTPPPIPDIKLDEKTAGLTTSFTFPNGWLLLGELSIRQFSGDVPTNLNGRTSAFDKQFLQYAIEGQAKPILPLDVALRWEHDVQPNAREVVKETTYNLASLHAAYSIFDWWDVWGSGQHYAFSDGNKRDHLMLTSDWLVWETPGIHVGLGYAYANAADANTDYWTPYKLNRYFAEAAFRGNYLRAYYNLRLRYGIGKQSVRPEAEARYQELLAQAQRERWPQSAVDALKATEPKEDWQPTIGASFSTNIKLGGNWEAMGEVSYNKVPDYNELNVTGGMKYRF
jgi:tetratricopeptide (TPR) repeat protein